VIKYVDEDGDLITLSSDKEFDHAVSISQGPFNLEITPLPFVQPAPYPLYPLVQSAPYPLQSTPYAPVQPASYAVVQPMQAISYPVHVANNNPYPGPFNGGDWSDYRRKCKEYKRTLTNQQDRVAFKAQFRQEKLRIRKANKEERKALKASKKRGFPTPVADGPSTPVAASPPKMLDQYDRPLLLDSVVVGINNLHIQEVVEVEVDERNVDKDVRKAKKRAAKDAFVERRRAEEKERIIQKRARKDLAKQEKRAKKDSLKAARREKKDLLRAERDRKEDLLRSEKRAKKDLGRDLRRRVD